MISVETALLLWVYSAAACGILCLFINRRRWIIRPCWLEDIAFVSLFLMMGPFGVTEVLATWRDRP